MVASDPLEKCLTGLLTMTDLDFEHPCKDPAILQTLLKIDKNEESVVIEEEMKTPYGLVLKELPKNKMAKYGVQHKKALAHHPQSNGQEEITNQAYWAIKQLNFALNDIGDKRLLQLNELEEIQNEAYENSLIYKDKAKRWHDKHILNKSFKEGDKVLLFNSRLKLFPRKLKSRWSGPCSVISLTPYGSIGLKSVDGQEFKVNG